MGYRLSFTYPGAIASHIAGGFSDKASPPCYSFSLLARGIFSTVEAFKTCRRLRRQLVYPLRLPHRSRAEGLGVLILSLFPPPSSLWFGEGMADTRGSEAPPDVLLAAIAFWILAISQRPLPVLLRPCSRKVRDRLGITGGALKAARLGLSPSFDSREKRGSLPPGLLMVSSGGIS
ncbi:hypothetical protein U1Q18_034449 [Sarracenia purpurea var. burkii]